MKKVLLIYGGCESYGLELISACLKQHGVKVELFLFSRLFNDSLLHLPLAAALFEQREKKRLRLLLQEFQPDIVGFSPVSLDFPWAAALASEIKPLHRGITIFGGIHASLVPERILREHPSIDLVCEGDGEEAMLGLCRGDNLPAIPNIWHRRNSLVIPPEIRRRFDFAGSALLPDKSLFFKRHPYFSHAGVYFFTRGCRFACSYCCHSYLKQLPGSNFAHLTPEQAITHLRQLAANHSIKRFIFNDDLFVFDFDWSRNFLKLYSGQINLPYSAVMHPCFVNREIATLLKQSNCRKIELGIESLDEKCRKEWLGRHEPNSVLISAMQELRRSKIPFNIQHILGAPGTSLKKDLQAGITYSFFHPGRIFGFFLTYFPCTALTEKALKHNLITREQHERIEKGFVGNFEHHGDIPQDMIQDYLALREAFTLIPRFPALCRILLRSGNFRFLRFLSLFFRIFDLPEIIFTDRGEYSGQIDILRYCHRLLGARAARFVRGIFDRMEH
ncbi:MAG: cobalamin-dependent protein [Candidatus Wallbacteria bacterium]|nr:cobalamin-dependent protein [Candidatus Wallbacteria bacterium]